MKNALVLFSLTLGLAASTALAGFTPGRVVVLHCDGVLTTGNNGYLEEYVPGTPGQTTPSFSVTLPNNGATDTGSSIVFGSSSSLNHDVSLSADGALVVVGGYANSYTSVDTASGANSPRVVATVKYDGTYALPFHSTSALSGGTFRSATSDGLGNFWAMGGNVGTIYLGTNSPYASIQGTTGRATAIAHGDLYYTLGAGLYWFGGGLPETATAGVQLMAASAMGGSASPAGFAISTNSGIAYIADYSGSAGIARFNYSGGTWTWAYNMTLSEKPQHIAVDVSGASPVLYATGTGGLKLYQFTDPGAGGSVTPTVLVTVTGNNRLRGVALSPKQPALPVFTTQPSGTTANYGDTVSFGPVAATGANPTAWTWKHGTTTLTDGGRISGATTTTLTISGIVAGDAGSYYAIAANNGGSISSDPAVLALQGSCINPQLVSRTNVAGSTATFTAGVSACATPIASYSWAHDGNPVNDGTGPSGYSTISGATTASLAVSNVQDGDAGLWTVTLTDGNSQPNSSAATLTVVDPPSITTQPANTNKAAGANVTFTVAATGGLLSYNWFKSPSSIPLTNGPTGTGATISGATTAALTITGVQTGDAGTYSVTVTNLAGSRASDPATLTVVHAPAILSLMSTNVAVGADAQFHVVVSGTPTFNYTWKHNGTTLFNDGSHIAGADTDTLIITNVQADDALSYTVTVESPYGSVSSNVFLGVEIASPKGNTVPGQFIYDPFDYPAGPYPASGHYTWDHIITIYNQQTGEPAFWTALGGLNAAVQANDLVNYVDVNRVPPGQYPWPGVDCNSVNHWYWSSAGNNNHLRFGGINQTNGAAYFSCLLHLDQGSALSGGTYDVIGGFTSDTTADNWNYKLCTQVSSGGDACWLGVFKGVGSGVNSSSVNGQWALTKPLGRGQLHFVVGCYKFNSGTNLIGGSLSNDDVVSLWIDPDRSTFGALETNLPAPDAGGMITNWANNAPIMDFGLKGTVPPASKRLVDLRIGSTWASVTPPYYPKLQMTSTPTDVTLSWPAKDTRFDPANNAYRGYTFQKADGITGSWTDITPPYTLDGTGTNDTYTESIGASSQFYRLINPPR